MRKTLSYGFKALNLAWQANGFYSILAIFSNLYESTLYPLIQVLLLAKLLDLLGQVKNLTFLDIGWIVTIYLLASLVKLGLKSFLDVREAFLQTQQEGFIDLQVSKKLTELDPATFEKPEFQSLIAQLEGVKGTLQMHLLRFTGLIDAVFKFITAAIVVSVTFPLFAPLIIIATIPSYIVSDRFRKKTWPFYVEKKSMVTRVTQYIKNLLSSDSTSKEAIIFQTGPVLLSKIKKEQKSYYSEFAKANDPWIIKILLARILQFGVFAYTQYLNISKVLQGTLQIGQFTLVFQQSLALTFSAEEILNHYSSIAARNKYLDKFFDFLDTKKVITSPSKSVAIPNKPGPPIIEFKDVAFKYPGTDREILKNFNLTIQSGEKVALVGENGAGKTTLIKLLLRFYDVTEGEILINGVNIKDVDLDEWHKHIGALFQDFIKYQFTFKENVYFGDLTKKQEEELLKEAIEKSGADKYLDTLPDKYDQVVGKMFEKGIDLSGGQWQKLALARAFFRNAPILILDEPTSAIDAKAEYEIFQKVQSLQKDKTVIIISHRFSTVRNADRIFVIDDGHIIEEGNHEKLMKAKGLYAELFNIQAQGYK
ncbi:MAG: ABC transporter ATP-binding protein/permease [Patescibacteria group bacterium]|nr:ABC transporter ATP-binding protein/permease [Actinomycetota bacterium]MCL5438508.1 ABC transporter ATP-binding protein/permease [Patescibacteria group bacterium]